MCTVTFLPLKNQGFILTSNRDEQKERKTLPPRIYKENNVNMLFPKDLAAGGTWIGVSDKHRIICVLNGGFEKHIRKISYGKSRGVITKELLQASSLETAVKNLDLTEVEPFTMVLITWHKMDYSLFELVWDGTEKHFHNLEKQPKIWSSSTLYTKENASLRASWFKNWLQENKMSQEHILDFHHLKKGNEEQSILMKRSYVETVSISSIKKTGETIQFSYEDLLESKHYKTYF